jgi:peptidoglycan/LPS O-acetylase OafA/YrhL
MKHIGERDYRSDIDGLRSIAILSVVLFHAGVLGISGGFTGVDVFFVISGYLIGGHIHSELERGTFSYRTFYYRRAKRILPALYAVLIALLLVSLVLFSPFELRRLASYSIATVLSSSNFLFWRRLGYFTPDANQNPLLMTWSLAVEEQFYLLIPLMMVLLSRLRRRLALQLIVLISVISFAIAWIESTRQPIANFYLLHSRAWELGVGVALAIAESRARKLPLTERGTRANLAGWIGLGMILAPFHFLGPDTPFPGPAALPSVAGSALLIASRGSWVNRSLLSLRALVFIGSVSYSWYLWHWPILALLRILHEGPLPLSWGLTAVTGALALAVLSYYFIERPFRASRTAPGTLLLRYCMVSAALLLVSGFIFKSGGLGQRYPMLYAMDVAKLKFEQDPCLAHGDETRPRITKFCSAAQSSGTKLALWGDSHAAALSPALRDVVARHGYVMQQYTRIMCPPLLGAARSDPSQANDLQGCISFNNEVLQRLIRSPDVKIVAIEASWSASLDPAQKEQLVEDGQKPVFPANEQLSLRIMTNSLRRTIESLQSAGKQVIVFGDVPRFLIDPSWRIRTSQIPARRKLVASLGAAQQPLDAGSDTPEDDSELTRQVRQIVMETALSFPGVTYWELRKQLCTVDQKCFYRQGESSYYVDASHLSPEGGQQALQGWPLISPTRLSPITAADLPHSR